MVRGTDKCASQSGRLLARVETWNDRTARLFAADCAEAVVHLCGDDPRPRAAIEMARRYARGEATREELDAAGAAAWAAAGDAAGA
ncbi:putative immunity protein, partial [Acinetobacter baumannii]